MREQKVDEASVVIKGLAASAPAGPYKLELERQIEELDRVAKLNRQIEVYNRAIGLANKGQSQQAQQMVDELIQAV